MIVYQCSIDNFEGVSIISLNSALESITVVQLIFFAPLDSLHQMIEPVLIFHQTYLIDLLIIGITLREWMIDSIIDNLSDLGIRKVVLLLNSLSFFNFGLLQLGLFLILLVKRIVLHGNWYLINYVLSCGFRVGLILELERILVYFLEMVFVLVQVTSIINKAKG